MKFNTLDLVSNLDLEAERKHASTTNKAARVKIEKGESWLVRFLPFPQGPQKQPFVRIASHWVGGRSFECKRHTAPALGGDPDAICPVCDVIDQMLNETSDKKENEAIWKIGANERYRGYCIVIAKDSDKTGRIESSPEELLVAHEFMIPKSSFATLSAKIERSKKRSPLGLLDLETGTDLWAIRDTSNKLSFDLSEDGPGPIFTVDDQFEAKLARVWKQMKQPTVKFLGDDRLNAIADMIAEKAYEKAAKSLQFDSDNSNNGSGRGGSSPRGGARTFHEAEEEAPRGRGRSSFSRAQAALDDPAQEQNGADDQIPGAEVPAREQEEAPARRPAAAAQPARTATTTARRAPVQVAAEPEPEPEATEAEGAPEVAGEVTTEAEQEAPPPVSPRRAAGSAVRQATPTRVAVPAGVAASRRAAGPLPPPPAAKAGGGRVEEESTAEDPPEEATDPAPPEQPEAEAAPATPAAKPARGALNNSLRQSVANMASRGR